MQKIKYSGLGMATGLANVMAAGTVSNTKTATGSSSQANSFAIVDDVTVFTTAASNSGARLPSTSAAGDVFFIGNLDANTMLIFPPTGGALNNGTVNTGSISLTTHKAAACISIDGTNFLVIVGG
jgi:hypothetical protein